jgi:putative transposase
MLGPEIRERLWPYLGGVAKQNSIRPACIGGVADHVHDTFRELHNFAWQEGYGAFSVSVSHLPETVDYIKNQAEHHRTRTFKEEYLAILKKHNLQFEDKYLWS